MRITFPAQCEIGGITGVELELRNNSHWRFASKIHLKCLTGCFAIGIGDYHAELPCPFGIAVVVENELWSRLRELIHLKS